ncbi:MAG: hypothetical protein PF637_05225 [Spirochaetes bacterium]|jgi:predicted PurR-regulated permease PerM|nr:hypothetical protein [Spirochaetota bacterium]
MNKITNFFKEFVFTVFIITAGSLFIHFLVSLITFYIQFGIYMISANQLMSIISASKIAILISYGILTLILYSFSKKLKETRDELKREKEKNEYNQQKLDQFKEIAAYILQNISEPNNSLRAWVERRKSSGSVSECVQEAVNRISNSLDLLSRTFFLAAYLPEPVTIPVKDEIRRLSK